MDRFPLNGALAVITGAGSGIGAALARHLAAQGTHLALADINAEGLQKTRAALTQNVRVSLHEMDVTDTDAADALPEAVQAAHGAPADILINNAGVALEGGFATVPEADFNWVLDINLHAPIRLTRAFLPVLASRPTAQIVNISSIFGIIAPPGQAAYSAAKFGLRGFSEALRHELAGSGVGVSVVHPGGVRTSIAKNARLTSKLNMAAAKRRMETVDNLLVLPPEEAARIITDGLVARKPRILVGRDAWQMDLVQRLMPTRYWTILRKRMGG